MAERLSDRFPPSGNNSRPGAVDLLVKSNRELLAENQLLRQAARQRSSDVAVQFVEGLGVLLELAAGGNKDAKAMIDLLGDGLAKASALRAGIILPPSN